MVDGMQRAELFDSTSFENALRFLHLPVRDLSDQTGAESKIPPPMAQHEVPFLSRCMRELSLWRDTPRVS